MTLPQNLLMLASIFSSKRVPLTYLDHLPAYREFHRPDFQQVLATLKPGMRVSGFDLYFDRVVQLWKNLKAVGNV